MLQYSIIYHLDIQCFSFCHGFILNSARVKQQCNAKSLRSIGLPAAFSTPSSPRGRNLCDEIYESCWFLHGFRETTGNHGLFMFIHVYSILVILILHELGSPIFNGLVLLGLHRRSSDFPIKKS